MKLLGKNCIFALASLLLVMNFQRVKSYEQNMECNFINKMYQDYMKPAEYAKNDNHMKRPVLLESFGKHLSAAYWTLTSVPGYVDTYFIKSSLYGEYLYALSDMAKIAVALHDRRPVYTDGSLTDVRENKAYMWRIMKIDTNLYELWNVRFNERKWH